MSKTGKTKTRSLAMHSDLGSLPDFEILHSLLMREGMKHSPNVWLNIHQLLATLAARDSLPQTPEILARLLSPIVCKNPQQQYRMPIVVNEWLKQNKPSSIDTKPTVQAKIHSPEQDKVVAWQQGIKQFNRRSWYYELAILVLLLVGFTVVLYPPPEPDRPIVTEKKLPPDDHSAPDPKTPTVPIIDRIAPNPLPIPEQLPDSWQRWLHYLAWIIPCLPILLAVLYLIWRYRKQIVLRNNAPQGDKLLTCLNLTPDESDTLSPFTGSEFIKSAAKLLHPVWTESRRLHIADSVIATANNFGFFTPRYQQRHNSGSECLILVQSIHGKDQAADFAELLVAALKKQKVQIRSYRFRDDPRRLIPWIQPPHSPDIKALSLEQLAQKRSDARLIVISEWNILFHPYQPERPQDWIKSFENWTRRVWLSSGYENERWAERATRQARQLNFRLLPLASEYIADMVKWLQEDGKRPASLGVTDDESEHLPAILSETADSWLDWRPPHGTDINRLCHQLQIYLSNDGLNKDGFLLLQALAVFPKPIKLLPQILDIQLFQDHSGNASQLRLERERRLQRLSRLPWLRFAYMPDYLRLALLKRLNKAERQKIRNAWAAILQKLTDEDSAQKLTLPIALPKISQIKIKNYLDAQTKNGAINDPIFANILLGGKLGVLDFSLPRTLNRLLSGSDKWLDLRPAFMAMLLASGSVWGLHHYWQSQGQQILIEFWQTTIEQQNADWQVIINYQTDTQALSEALAKSLQAIKFQVPQPQTQSTQSTQSTQAQIQTAKPSFNQINYATGGKTSAQRVAQNLRWLSYGANVALQEQSNLTSNTLQVQLAATYQHTAGFNDTLRYPYSKLEKTDNSKIDDNLIEPEMVAIPAGSFMMGSPDKEANGNSNESPQHKVTIPAFTMSKYEVTFEQYDVFAKATGRKLPDDQGWGRDKRPVINVSFKDAQAYVDWLSKQTRKTYRLPTEAEWEYAARANTDTAYFWGNDENKASYFAWFSQNSDQKTQPVGENQPNAFGLYDTAGNVWEWTQDCWHDNYKFAPDDNSAWLENTGGNCNHRALRGGAWYYDFQYLRSAYRLRFNSDLANFNLGFRVASDMAT